MRATPVRTARQEELLDLALALVREVGLAGLTVRKLAERAGFTEAALYRHFPDKEALLLAMIERLAEEKLLGPIRALAADRGRPPAERLAAVVRHHVTTVLAVDGLPVLVLAEAAAAGQQALLARFRHIVGELMAILDGLLGELPPPGDGAPSRRAVALTLVGMTAATALHHRLFDDPALEREARERLPEFLVERLSAPAATTKRRSRR